MSKMDDFKKFVSENPHLKKKIDRKETTWQELYEHYDLFGEEDELFKKSEERDEKSEPKNENKDNSLSGLFEMLKGVDIDKIADGLNGMRRVLGILGELSLNQRDQGSSNRQSRPYKREDD